MTDMSIKGTLSCIVTTAAAAALLASCGSGIDDAEGSTETSEQTTAAEAAPAYESLDDVVAAMSTAADCDAERWETKKTSLAADGSTGMPAVDYTYSDCSLPGDDSADATAWIYFAPTEGTSAEIVQALKVDMSVFDSYLIQGDKWVVRVDKATIRGGSGSGGDEERDAYSKELASALKSSLDENAQIIYKD